NLHDAASRSRKFVFAGPHEGESPSCRAAAEHVAAEPGKKPKQRPHNRTDALRRSRTRAVYRAQRAAPAWSANGRGTVFLRQPPSDEEYPPGVSRPWGRRTLVAPGVHGQFRRHPPPRQKTLRKPAKRRRLSVRAGDALRDR